MATPDLIQLMSMLMSVLALELIPLEQLRSKLSSFFHTGINRRKGTGSFLLEAKAPKPGEWIFTK